ncbi:hypothetical protein ACWOHG_004557 [Vibrio parahaemolyticus]
MNLDDIIKVVALIAAIMTIIGVLIQIFRTKHGNDIKGVENNGSNFGVVSGNKNSLTVNSTTITNSIHEEKKEIPEALAMPSLHFRQTGCSIGGYSPNTYDIEVHNTGGACHRLLIKQCNPLLELANFPDLKTDAKKRFRLNEPADSIEVKVEGYDANGKAFHRTYLANRTFKGYKFT